MFLMFENYLGLYIIVCCVVSSFSAQLFKVLVPFFLTGKFNLKLAFATGGMPSSHSAFVSCLATLIGCLEGLDSIFFAIAVCFAVIVMHDAMNVRHAVGVQAQSLNNLHSLFEEIIDEMSEFLNNKQYELKVSRIKELLGHSPLEVYAGCFYGILIGYISYLVY